MGQDGAYLAKFLLSKKYKVYGAYRRNSNYENNRLRKLGIENKINLIDLMHLYKSSFGPFIQNNYVTPDWLKERLA